MTRILFVDDEPHLLDGLKRALRGMRSQWDMAFANGGPQALEVLAQEAYDVIVTDMRMPGMDGAALLTEVRRLYPHMTRIVLSGHTEKMAIMTSVRLVHQFLSKPCDPDKLRAVLAQTEHLRVLLKNETIVSLVAQIEALPPLPGSYVHLLEALDSEDTSLEVIAKLISQDMAMTATVLKLVNSAFFGLPHHVASPTQAVGLLGLDIIKGLVLSQGLFKTMEVHLVPGMSFELLWHHCMVVGCYAKQIISLESRDKSLVDSAFIAGLMHDVGKLVLATILPQQYDELIQRVRQENRLVWSLEGERLGTTHCEVGAYLLGLWGVPGEIVRAIALHNQPDFALVQADDNQRLLLAAVHAANALEHELNIIHQPYARPSLDQDFLTQAGLWQAIPRWRQACQNLCSRKDHHGADQAV